MILDIKNYTKQFIIHILNGKKIHALSDVSFSVQAGMVVGLTGKSGSGKSTLMKSVYRTYLASGGQILYHSLKYGVIDLVQASDHQVLALRKAEITYCSQFLSVIPRVPAVEVVAESLLKNGIARPQALAAAQGCLHRLGLPEALWEAYPATFSGGEQQRINVARAVIAKPRLLLIDEPTASLDLKTKNIVIEMITELKHQGTSVLCISHDVHTLEHLADYCLELKEGKLIR